MSSDADDATKGQQQQPSQNDSNNEQVQANEQSSTSDSTQKQADTKGGKILHGSVRADLEQPQELEPTTVQDLASRRRAIRQVDNPKFTEDKDHPKNLTAQKERRKQQGTGGEDL